MLSVENKLHLNLIKIYENLKVNLLQFCKTQVEFQIRLRGGSTV
jgi:hypothetical protein